MNTLNLHFIHPTDGRELNVEVEGSMTSFEAIQELVNAAFIPSAAEGYKLSIREKTGKSRELIPDESFASSSVANESRIQITPATDAGSF